MAPLGDLARPAVRMRWPRLADIGDRVRACARIFASPTGWTVVRGGDLEEGPSEALAIRAGQVGDPRLASNRTRRTDFALFMVEALDDKRLVRKARAIVSRHAPSATPALPASAA